jgi:ABC-type uncharacterized transport system substrate-binding protein
MKRREFLSLAGGAAALPLVARAQQADRIRRVGILWNLDGVISDARLAAFHDAMQKLGWRIGDNLLIERRSANDSDGLRKLAEELVAFSPDVVLTTAAPATAAMQQITQTVPIVFVMLADPVGGGFVNSLSHPGGNTTGFTPFEFSIASKWLELLKEIAPGVNRVAILRDPANPNGLAQFAAMQSVAPSLNMLLNPIGGRNAAEIERAISTFARDSRDGLVVTAGPLTTATSELIVSLSARYKLPAVYPFRFFSASGGLVSYGPDTIEPYRQAASYVDRILKGERSADLPVQGPTKYELVINLKTAKVLGLTVPTRLLASADEVIE